MTGASSLHETIDPRDRTFEAAVVEMFRRLPGVEMLDLPEPAWNVNVNLALRVEDGGPGGLSGIVLVRGAEGGLSIGGQINADNIKRLARYYADKATFLIIGIGDTEGNSLFDVGYGAALFGLPPDIQTKIWGRQELLSLSESYPDALAPILPLLAEQEDPRQRAEVEVVRTEKGWHLDADAFVLPLGPRGGGTGAVYRAFMADLSNQAAAKVEARIRKFVKEGFSQQTPVIMPASQNGFSRPLILATAYENGGPIKPGIAVRAILQLAERSEFSHIVLPVLGSAQLDLASAIKEIGTALADTSLGRKFRVTLVVVDENTEKLAQPLVWPPAKPLPSSSGVLHYNSDAVDDDSRKLEDKLGVEAQARTFARLLADTHVTLPLAIGLFGNWGSGKTFFMKLIRQEMDKLPPQDPRSKVVHVTFNAWHYLDTNLWASLGLRIFEGVASHLATATGHATKLSDTAAEIARLTAKIDSSQRLKAAAEQQLRAAEQARQNSEANIADTIGQRVRQAKAISITILTQYLGDDWSKEFRRHVVAFGGGSPKNLAELEEAIAKVSETRASLERLLPGPVLRLPRFWRLLAVVGAGLALGMMWTHRSLIADLVWPWVAAWWPQNVDLGLGGALASAAGVASWIAQRLAAGQEAAEHLKRLTERIHLALAAAEAKDLGVKKLNKLDSDIADHRRRIVEAEHEMAAATTRLQQVEAGALVYDFLSQRATDSRYVDNTGIIATLRRDLKTLEDNIADMNPSVRRIVLYIDDLDRCDPDKVVDVLQAVHLLLAFKLFAVVVAVDPRWLEQSLYKRYLPNFAGMSDDDRAASEFSPHNYLEKIFQIPFHLPRLADGDRDRDRFKRLIESLVPSAPDETTVKPNEDDGAGPPEENTSSPPADDQPSAEPAPNPPSWWGRLMAAMPWSRWRPAPSLPRPESALQPPTPTEPPPAIQSPPRPTASSPPLILTPRETDLLASMHPFIPTPRAAKRLVNVYLLIRLQVENENPSLGERLKDENDQAARALITLLAIDIGFPRPAQLLRSKLNSAKTDDLSTILTDLRKRCWAGNLELGHQFDDLLEALRGVAPHPGTSDLCQWLPFANRFSFHSPEDPDDTLALLAPKGEADASGISHSS